MTCWIMTEESCWIMIEKHVICWIMMEEHVISWIMLLMLNHDGKTCYMLYHVESSWIMVNHDMWNEESCCSCWIILNHVEWLKNMWYIELWCKNMWYLCWMIEQHLICWIMLNYHEHVICWIMMEEHVIYWIMMEEHVICGIMLLMLNHDERTSWYVKSWSQDHWCSDYSPAPSDCFHSSSDYCCSCPPPEWYF